MQNPFNNFKQLQFNESKCDEMTLSIFKKSKTFFPAPAWPPVMLPGFPKNKIIFCFFTFYHCARIKFFLLNWIILRFFTFYNCARIKFFLLNWISLRFFTFYHCARNTFLLLNWIILRFFAFYHVFKNHAFDFPLD